MTTPSDIEWLQRRWDLPEARSGLVARLLAAIGEGSTAVPVTTPSGAWGKAVAEMETGTAVPAEPRPLVIVKDGGHTFLQSWLHFYAEYEIAARLHRCLVDAPAASTSAERLAQLFPGTAADDLQVRATRTALARQLAIITGGPGTGKTYTLARILALLVEGGVTASRIRLAAPTGKAADRMRRAVGESLATLPPAFSHTLDGLRSVADSSTTLHTLLGYNPSTGRCRFGVRDPLPCDVLILDECSMIDVLLWRAVLRAASPGTRLVLLGDPNQLESIGVGNVLAELVETARSAPGLAGSWVHLTEARRFKERPGILLLARALEARDPDAAVNLLKGLTDASTGISWIPGRKDPPSWHAFPETVRAALKSIARAASPEEALATLSRVCILTAHREYPSGAKALSRMIEEHLLTTCREGFNHPVIIDRNDPETGLRNGSVGVICRRTDGSRAAFFPPLKAGDSLRVFPVAQLPEHSPAWALTIHRSQGSEFDEVFVALPQHESPLATRELIYTAITRARMTVHISGDLETIRSAVKRDARRTTLVGRQLAAACRLKASLPAGG